MAYFSKKTCFFSQCHYLCSKPIHGHWLLSDALCFAISLSLKQKDGNELLSFFESLMEDEFNLVNELTC